MPKGGSGGLPPDESRQAFANDFNESKNVLILV